MWGSLGFDGAEEAEVLRIAAGGKEEKRQHVVLKADLAPCRAGSLERKEQLRESDFALGGFEFFARADEGYNRTLPELTLHQVLRRLMRLVERQLIANAEKLEAKVDVTLLHPPNEKERVNFYTGAAHASLFTYLRLSLCLFLCFPLYVSLHVFLSLSLTLTSSLP